MSQEGSEMSDGVDAAPRLRTITAPTTQASFPTCCLFGHCWSGSGAISLSLLLPDMFFLLFLM